MQAEQLIRKYINQPNIMQLATIASDQPYLCTVHYYADDDFNLYWCSTLERRHSQEIKHNPQTAAYILVHENTAEEDYVIGITILGKAELIGAAIDQQVCSAYGQKISKDPNFVSDTISDTGPHKFYRLQPTKIVLFDNKHFPDDPRQEWQR
jgi:nitroimidazol reductase NimA-like FMN-containing flavoprotein (pyridoxamine 5'-phosphate oxidase superfamily)